MSVTDLVYRLTADTTGLQSQLGSAQRDVRKFSRRATSDVRKLGVAFATIGTTVGAALGKLIADTIKTGEELSLLSDQTGISVENLSRLGFAADQSGGDLESAARAVGRLQIRLGQADRDGGSFADTLSELGISLRDDVTGETRDTLDVLAELSDAFVGAESAEERARLGNEAFGRSWQELAPLLMEGKDGLEDLMQQADDLGIVMSQEAADASRQLGDNVNVLRSRATALGVSLTSQIVPALAGYADEAARSARETGNLAEQQGLAQKATVAILRVVEGIRVSFIVMGETLGAVGAQLVVFAEGAVNNLRTLGRGVSTLVRGIAERDTAVIAGAFRNTNEQLRVNAEDAANRSAEVWSLYAEDVVSIIQESDNRIKAAQRSNLEDFTREAEKNNRKLQEGAGNTTAAIEEIDEEVQRLTRSMEQQLRRARTPLEEFGEEWWDLVAALEAGIISESQFQLLEERLEQALDPFGDHARMAEEEAARMSEALRMDGLAEQAERVRAEIAGIDLRIVAHLQSLQELRDEGLITWQEYEMAVAQVVGEMENAEEATSAFVEHARSGVEMLASTLIDGLVDPFNSSVQDMAANFIQQITRMVLETAAQRAILAAFGGGIGFSAGGPVPGFASGGFVSGPGTSTSDSIPARLSAGEYVMPASSVNQFGVGFFDQLRRGSIPGYAAGGLVQRPGGGGSESSSGGSGVKVVVVDDQRAAAIEALRSPAGEQVILQTIQKRRGDF